MAFTKIVNTGIGTITDPFSVPKGTTANRPVGISSGVIRYNTTTEQFEGYSNSWGSLVAEVLRRRRSGYGLL